ncbi:hypothetical protein [Faecalibacter rhinopitheci]|uniref:Uncharacterized protein n=1 Tax=Faecalibacter rhinopitheci TaxID=2779678 RepID=A0A8J7KBC0_9FLAO|nr:hypothetical protein [Faecalibacter rhinopitheci]MBF0598435.1 hypothetical protein [Faecalibacter rhinopitheci]
MHNIEVKNKIKILCEFFSYKITYENDILRIFNPKNEISIKQTNKNQYLIIYNTNNSYDEIEVYENEVFDALINIIYRIDLEKIELNEFETITLEILKEFEYSDKHKLEDTLEKIIKQNIENKNIGGNRILHKYYKGYLILMDDLNGCLKSNVIKL